MIPLRYRKDKRNKKEGDRDWKRKEGLFSISFFSLLIRVLTHIPPIMSPFGTSS